MTIKDCDLPNKKLKLSAADSLVVEYGEDESDAKLEAIIERAQSMANKENCTVEIVLVDGDSYDVIYPDKPKKTRKAA